MHQEKRKTFMRRIKGGVAILPSAVPAYRNHDTEYKYRQDSNFYYLTGFDEPDSICVIAPDHPQHQYILFVNPGDPKLDAYIGKRTGVEGAKRRFGADMAYPISEFDAKIGEYLRHADRLYYSFGSDEAFNRKVIELIKQGSRRRIREATGPNTVIDPREILSEMRLIKDREELRRLRRATEISVEAHIAAMQAVRPGMYEYELEALVDSIFRRRGGGQAAFPTIVASGANATTLHYIANNCQIAAGNLVLIDAGCEYMYYNGDITRTFPSNGKFTDAQRDIYQLVLDVHMALIETIRPGASIDAPNRLAIELLTDGMIRLGILDGEKEKLIEEEKYKSFFRYRVGHMIGLDVHDVNKYAAAPQNFTWKIEADMAFQQTFQPGMVTTIEPGLYISRDSENVPPQYLGIGVRIEDDILVTESGYENLTADVPKTIDEIERLMGK